MGITGGVGSSPYMGMMAGTQSAQRAVGAQGNNAREIADNSMAQKMLPMQAAENAGRAFTEAKGMFVDTYA